MATLLAFFGIGLTDPDFAAIATKPDNIPITALMFMVVFFLWFAMKQARANDRRIAEGKKPAEAGGGGASPNRLSQVGLKIFL